jgi:hypothetical protein
MNNNDLQKYILNKLNKMHDEITNDVNKSSLPTYVMKTCKLIDVISMKNEQIGGDLMESRYRLDNFIDKMSNDNDHVINHEGMLTNKDEIVDILSNTISIIGNQIGGDVDVNTPMLVLMRDIFTKYENKLSKMASNDDRHRPLIEYVKRAHGRILDNELIVLYRTKLEKLDKRLRNVLDYVLKIKDPYGMVQLMQNPDVFRGRMTQILASVNAGPDMALLFESSVYTDFSSTLNEVKNYRILGLFANVVYTKDVLKFIRDPTISRYIIVLVSLIKNFVSVYYNIMRVYCVDNIVTNLQSLGVSINDPNIDNITTQMINDIMILISKNMNIKNIKSPSVIASTLRGGIGPSTIKWLYDVVEILHKTIVQLVEIRSNIQVKRNSGDDGDDQYGDDSGNGNNDGDGDEY